MTIRVSQDSLATIRALHDVKKIPGLPSQFLDSLKELRKQWWEDMKLAYDLPADALYKVVTHGENAGELRYKNTGEPVEEQKIEMLPFIVSFVVQVRGNRTSDMHRIREELISIAEDAQQTFENYEPLTVNVGGVTVVHADQPGQVQHHPV